MEAAAFNFHGKVEARWTDHFFSFPGRCDLSPRLPFYQQWEFGWPFAGGLPQILGKPHKPLSQFLDVSCAALWRLLQILGCGRRANHF